MSPKRPISGHSIIKMAKIKDKEEIWKPSSHIQGYSHKAMDWLLSRNSASHQGVAHSIWSDERTILTTKNTLSSKAHVHIRRRNQKFCRGAKAKSWAPVLQEMLKELLLEKKKRPQLEKWNVLKEKTLISKVSVTAKAADELLMKLGERRKEKVAKLATSATRSQGYRK